MNIVPTRIQEQISQVDRTYSLVIGISAGIDRAVVHLPGVLAVLHRRDVLQRGLVARLAGLPPGAVGRVLGRCRIRIRGVPAPIRQATLN